MLVMESLFPFALPLATGLVVYAVAGLAISLMIITLEKATDGTLKKLKNARNEDLKKLHMAEQVGTIDRLELRAEKYIPSFSTQKMLLIQGPLSPNSSPKSESPPANFLSHSASECDLHKRRLEATNC